MIIIGVVLTFIGIFFEWSAEKLFKAGEWLEDKSYELFGGPKANN